MDENHAKLQEICKKELESRGMSHLSDRLNEELHEIEAQSEAEYLLELYDKKVKFNCNEHNLIVSYLLGLVDDFNSDKEASFSQGEYPDIDTDYLLEVRDYLKNVWAPKTFGEENVCSIGTYGTLGIKMALKDMTRVHGMAKDEIEQICKNIPDKDDDGKQLQWDKALDLCKDLKDYCDRNQDVANAVRILLDRRKSGSVHAGGLIISNTPIADFVPLEVRSVDKTNKYGVIASAWGEGLHSQDLGAVGLVKFDMLVVEGLKQIAVGCQLIKERYNVDHICNKPGQRNWSDTAYLEDKAALDIANRGDTKCIFQFGSEGIRKMIKNGGVTSFKDIAAYSALYRPGPMGMLMHERYCDRKRGREKYTLHPLLRPILGSTYGVMVFQEQVLKILNIIGGIPDMHCEKVRKAISKKKIKEFSKYKVVFLKNGQINLGADEKYVQELWDQVEAFSDYGFNKSMITDTLIPTPHGSKKLSDFNPGDLVYGVNEQGNVVTVPVVVVHDHGVLDGYEITFEDGSVETCSKDHKFLTPHGQMPLWEIDQTQTPVYCAPQYYDNAKLDKDCQESTQDLLGKSRVVPDTPGHVGITDSRNMVLRRIIRIVPVGKKRMCDLEVASKTHNFILTNGIVTSNSHSYAYSFITARQLWLLAHYPMEFYCSMLMCEKDVTKIKEIKIDAEMHGIKIAPIHINKSQVNFSIQKDENDGLDKIFYGFSNLQKIGSKPAERIISGQPYDGFEDFLKRFGTEGAVVKALVSLNAFGGNNRLRLYKFSEYWKDWINKKSAAKKRFENSLLRYESDLKSMLEEYRSDINSEDYDKMCVFSEEARELWEKYFCDMKENQNYTYKGEVRTRTITVLKKFQDLYRKRENSISGRDTKDKDSIKLGDPVLSNFDDLNCNVEIEEDVEKLMTEDIRRAEEEYYGYQWIHVLEESPDYTRHNPLTIDRLLGEWPNVEHGIIEVLLKEVKKTKSKKSDNFYYVLSVEDSNGRMILVTMWSDDYERFKEDLKPGNLLRMRVVPPEGGWNRWSFETVQRHMRRHLPTKELDFRLYVMRSGKKVADPKSDSEILMEK